MVLGSKGTMYLSISHHKKGGNMFFFFFRRGDWEYQFNVVIKVELKNFWVFFMVWESKVVSELVEINYLREEIHLRWMK